MAAIVEYFKLHGNMGIYTSKTEKKNRLQNKDAAFEDNIVYVGKGTLENS